MFKLIRGIVEFRKTLRPGYRETFAKLALGQRPDALFIACSDSRVVPNLFASTDPGDLFVVRNVGNMVPHCSASDSGPGAAVEYAVTQLGVRFIVICGHSECGAAGALLQPISGNVQHLANWLKHGEKAIVRLKESLAPDTSISPQNQVSQINTLLQLENLMSYPSVRAKVESGELTLHAWWFDIKRAEVQAYSEESRKFIVIDDKEANRILVKMGYEPLVFNSESNS